MGTLVKLPKFSYDALNLPKSMTDWLSLHVGTRGDQWGASYSWLGGCWVVSFVDPRMATLFKITWA